MGSLRDLAGMLRALHHILSALTQSAGAIQT
jgi:hypothetical protein